MSTIKVSQINKKIKLLPEDLLQEVNDYIDFLTYKYAQNDWANELTNEQIALVEKGKKDIIENKTISHHEARKKIDDYIKKQNTLMEIVWSETALETFFKVIDYLFDNWTEKEIETFDDNVEALIQRIATHNQICPESKLFGYRKCVIDEHNSLVYHIVNDTLFLVTFLDNRSSHSY